MNKQHLNERQSPALSSVELQLRCHTSVTVDYVFKRNLCVHFCVHIFNIYTRLLLNFTSAFTLLSDFLKKYIHLNGCMVILCSALNGHIS